MVLAQGDIRRNKVAYFSNKKASDFLADMAQLRVKIVHEPITILPYALNSEV